MARLDLGRALREARAAPESIPDIILRVARPLGATDVVVYLVDFEQTTLEPLPERGPWDENTSLRLYLREAVATPLITPAEEVLLAHRIQAGDEAAREHMIKANLRLVVKIAREYEDYGLPLLDLINEGNLGLMKGVERFDPRKGAKLSTYASWWIKQNIKLALANHPDRNPGDAEAVERFKEAAEAFEVLSNAEKKAIFDRYGHAGLAGRGAGGGFNDPADIMGAFGDLFEGIFGGQGDRGRRRAQRGDSLRCTIDIDLGEAAAGCTRTIEIERAELCSTCDGSGARSGSSPERCSYCGGSGQAIQSHGFFRVQTTCVACRGSGKIIRDKCARCFGSGREKKKTKLEVTVPAGVDTGMQLCLRGEGEPGGDGGPRGDLYCDIRVAEHPFFKREGQHLTCRIPINFSQAALGTELEIPLLHGRHKLTIPAGTQPGEVFRLRSKGMPDPHSKRRGDLLIEVQVEVPKKVAGRQEELIRELAELDRANVNSHHKSFFEKLKDYFVPSEEVADPG